MSTAYEGLRPTQSGQGRGVVGMQNQTSCCFAACGLGNQSGLGLRMRTPEQEHTGRGRASNSLNYSVSERLPTLLGMASGLAIFYAQPGVEQQHAMLRPWNQTGLKRGRQAQIVLKFFENITQRWRWSHPRRH